MKKNIFTILITLFCVAFASAQINFQPSFGGGHEEENPVVWTFSQEKLSHAPARPRGQVHGGLAVLVAAGQGRQLLVEPPAAGQG